MTMFEIYCLLAGLWFGMGFTCWAVPTWAALPREGVDWVTVLSLPIMLVLGPVALVLYAQYERGQY